MGYKEVCVFFFIQILRYPISHWLKNILSSVDCFVSFVKQHTSIWTLYLLCFIYSSIINQSLLPFLILQLLISIEIRQCNLSDIVSLFYKSKVFHLPLLSLIILALIYYLLFKGYLLTSYIVESVNFFPQHLFHLKIDEWPLPLYSDLIIATLK